MVNVFLKYSIAIPFLIILLTTTISHSCVYNKTAMLITHRFVLTRIIENVEDSLKTNFSSCCNTRKDTTFVDVCNNFTKVDETRRNFSSNCYNNSRNKTYCCQFKNLFYVGCLLGHYTRHLKPNKSSAIAELKSRLNDLVQHNNDYLCVKPIRKKQKQLRKRHTQEHKTPRNHKCRREICKLNDTLQRYVASWQEFSASTDCT
ncbi:uncharacterized protein LOC122939261 [Bufo gargarizans]|uniref:uncharacterized protein LOC122939261 n=1 Tax=Bufo gargarizans TaxID=30331 RepID=UPI001CF36776|nr:uncharacterized protein LOC122939261 [Bufo gargarizans]